MNMLELLSWQPNLMIMQYNNHTWIPAYADAQAMLVAGTWYFEVKYIIPMVYESKLNDDGGIAHLKKVLH